MPSAVAFARLEQVHKAGAERRVRTLKKQNEWRRRNLHVDVVGKHFTNRFACFTRSSIFDHTSIDRTSELRGIRPTGHSRGQRGVRGSRIRLVVKNHSRIFRSPQFLKKANYGSHM